MIKKETELTKAEIISQLTKSVHAGGATKRKKGEKLPKQTPDQKDEALIARLRTYLPVALTAVKQDEHFFTRLVAWNHQKGQVRDAQVALPVIGLNATDPELLESNLAHMADLRPREFKRAVMLAKALGVKRNTVRRLVARWLKELELQPNWERQAVLHGRTLKWLYGRYHVKPGLLMDGVLFKALYTPGSISEAVAAMKTAPPAAISATITRYKLSWMVIKDRLGAKLKDPDVLTAVIGTMTPTELVTNMATLEKYGVKDHAITRAALEQALGKAATAKGSSKTTLKASVAAEAVKDEVLSGKLKVLQEKQLDVQKGIEGDWIVCGDMSPSMQDGVATAVEIAGVLVRLVRGKVILVFFNENLVTLDVTGRTLDEIKHLTRFVKAGGSGTRSGICLDWLTEKKTAVEGVAIVGDGGDNHPGEFRQAYDRYVRALGNEPSVYFYKLKPGLEYANSHTDTLSGQLPDMKTFDLRGGIDYYALPNLVQMMRVGKYSLTDEILNTPLRTLNEVLDSTTTMEVIVKQREEVGA